MSRASKKGIGWGVLCVLALSCGEDKPTAPNASLIGVWVFQGVDMPETSTANLLANLEKEGVTPAAAAGYVANLKNDIQDYYRSSRNSWFVVMRLNADGTYEDNDGAKGTYSITDNRLTITPQGQPALTGQYFVTDTILTFIMAIFDLVKLDEAFYKARTPVERAVVEVLFDKVYIRFFFRKADEGG